MIDKLMGYRQVVKSADFESATESSNLSTPILGLHTATKKFTVNEKTVIRVLRLFTATKLFRQKTKRNLFTRK